jgi:hypothetical protein
VGHEHDLEPVPQLAVGRAAEGVFQPVQFVIGEVNPDHGGLGRQTADTSFRSTNPTVSVNS